MLPVTAGNYIIASPAQQVVVAAQGKELVVAALAQEEVVSVGPPQSVGTISAYLGDRQGYPTCHQQGKGHGGQQQYGAPHKETASLCRGAKEEKCQTPPRCVTEAAYPCVGEMYVRHGTKHGRAPRKRRTSENPQNANFAKTAFSEVRRCWHHQLESF